MRTGLHARAKAAPVAVLRPAHPTQVLQRKCACGGTFGPTGECDACRKKRLQRKVDNREANDSAVPPIVREVLRSPGQPLDSETRAFMEPRFGHNFADVRVHSGARAAESARAVNANAYTVGRDVVFGNGRYRAREAEGRRLLAHELTHVVQQRDQPHSTASDLAINSPGDSFEHEADAAEQVVAARSTSSIAATAAGRCSLQRDDFEPWPGQVGVDVGAAKKEGTKTSGSVQRTHDPQYTQPLPIALEFDEANCTVISTMEINFLPATKEDDRLTADRFDKLKTRMLSVANEKLNGWMHVQVGADKACTACSGKTININVVAKEGSGPGATSVILRKGTGRADAGTIPEGGEDWFTSLFGGISDGTLWHESGHIVLGLPDEYPAEAGDPPRPKNRINTSDWSIMSSHHDYGRRSVMQPRHFSFITAWLGRQYADCKFDLVANPIPFTLDVVAGVTFTGSAIGSGLGFGELGDLAVGIPLDQQRRFRGLIGAYGGFISALEPQARFALLTGALAGLDYSTDRSGGGFGVRGDVRLGVGQLTPPPGAAPPGLTPTIGGNLTLGYAGPRGEIGATAGAGKFLGGAGANDPYFTLGVRLGVNF